MALHADHGDSGHGRRRRDGGRSLAERLSVQGDVLRRDDRDPRQLARRSGAALHRHPGQHVHASPTRCASSATCSSARRRPTCRARRTSLRSGCGCRPSFSCWPALSSASLPAVTVGPILDTAVRAVLGASDPRHTASLSGTASPRAPDERRRDRRRRRRVLSCCAPICSRAATGRPCCAAQWRSAFSTGCSSSLSWRLARWLEGSLGTRRLQPQLQLLVGAAFVAALCAALSRGGSRSGLAARRSRSRLRAGLGGRDRLRARRRLPGQVSSPCGADPARRRRPRHLHQLRLAVRARSRPDAACRRDRDDGAPSARPAMAAQTRSSWTARRHARRAIRWYRVPRSRRSRSAPELGWRCSPMRQ